MVTQQSIQKNYLINSLKKSLIQRQISERNKQNSSQQGKNNTQNYLNVQEHFQTVPKTLGEINLHGERQQISNKQSPRLIDPSIDVQQNFFKQGVKKSIPVKNIKTNNQASRDSSTLKGIFYFETQSKNGLEAMEEAIENKQRTLRIVCGECKKESGYQNFKKDKLFLTKQINKICISLNSQLFKKNIQNPEIKQVQNPNHFKRNYSENFSKNLRFALVKSQSGKNLLQNETDKQKLYYFSMASRKLTKPAEGFSFESQVQSRSTLDENCKINTKQQIDSNLAQNQKLNNKQRLMEKIKQINNKFSHFDIINSRKFQIKNTKSNNLQFQDKNHLSSISSLVKNKAHQKINHSELDKTKDDMKSQYQIDEIYGPWDINQFDTDSNCFPSQVSITNLNEYKNQL
ncbi:hypothetical protein ABPG72_004668 [Tetrahymena utriculariae]